VVSEMHTITVALRGEAFADTGLTATSSQLDHDRWLGVFST